MLGDEEAIQDGKYRNYVAAIEKALKNFEYSSDWPDLINALTKLNKVITSHSGKYKIIPKRLLLTKRLSQCLHVSLPSGVHLKALETYDLIFKTIGVEKLRADLFIYATGLFPLLNYAGLGVKPPLLKIYETYFLPLQEDLVPCLDGFLQGILLGMEESADNERSCQLLDAIKVAVSPPVFYTVLWRCTLAVPKLRQASINYLLVEKESIVGNDIQLVKAAILACLADVNILVQRLSLELLSTRDLLEKEVDLVKAALSTLLRRDASLNRRLFNWLTDCDQLLIDAIQSLLCDNDEDNYRILVYLFDKQSKGSDYVLKSVLVDIIRSIYIHNTSHSAGTIFFSTLNSHYVWNLLFSSVHENFTSAESASVQKPGSGSPPLPELCLLIAFLISSDFLESGELDVFSLQLLDQIQAQLDALPLSNLICLLNLCKAFTLHSALRSVSTILTQFVSKILFSLDIEETFQKMVTAKPDFEEMYAADHVESFSTQILNSLTEMTSKVPFNLPPVTSHADPHILEAFKVMSELTLLTIRNWKGQENLEEDQGQGQGDEEVTHGQGHEEATQGQGHEDAMQGQGHDDVKQGHRHDEVKAEIESILKCFIIAAVCESPGIATCAISSITYLIPHENCRVILNTTAAVEQIAAHLWEVNDLVTLEQFIACYPDRIERLFITKTAEVDFDAALIKIKKLLDKKAPFDRLVCKILDGLHSDDATVLTRSEQFVTEHVANGGVGIILSPLLRILRAQLKLTRSVLSGDCRSLSEQRAMKSADDDKNVDPEAEVSADGEVESTDKVDDTDGTGSVPGTVRKTSIPRPTSLLMDSSGRFTAIPIIKQNGSDDEFDEMDEDNYLGLLDGPLLQSTESHAGSLGDINHNDTKTNSPTTSIKFNLSQPPIMDGSINTVTFLSITAIDPDKDFEVQEKSQGQSISTDVTTAEPDSAATTPILPRRPGPELQTFQHQRLFSIHPYTTQMLIYCAGPDLPQMLYALKLLRRVIEVDSKAFLQAVITVMEQETGLTFLELMVETVLRSFEAFVMERTDDLISVHVEALRIIEIVLSGFTGHAYKDILGSIMLKLHLPKTILYVAVTLPTLECEDKLTSTEEIMRLNYENIVMIYREVVRVTTVLIGIESELKYCNRGGGGGKSKSSRQQNYSANIPMIRQPLYVDSIRTILSDDKVPDLHLIILDSITKCLRFYKEEKVTLDVIKVIIGILGSEAKGRNLIYLGKILDALTTILHFIVLEETVVSEKVQASPGLLSNLVSVFVGGSSTPASTPGQQQQNKGKGIPNKVSLLSLLPNLLSSIVGIYSAFQQSLNSLLNPIAVSYCPQFIQAVGRVEPSAGADLVWGMKVLSLESLVAGVDSFLKQSSGNGMSTGGNGLSPLNTPEEDSFSIAVNLLTFLSHYLDKNSNVVELSSQLILLVKNTFILPVQVQLAALVIYYKLVKAMCVGKECNKELQDLGGKILDSICTTSMEKRAKSELTSTQTLETLNTYLTSLLDLVWVTTEEKLPINTIVAFLMLFLRGKFPQQSYILSSALLAKLSNYPNLRKSWKKEIFELLLEGSFFHFPPTTLKDWMTVFDNLFSDKATFQEFLARVSVPQTGSLNIFSSKEVEYELRGMLLKRLAFVIYSSPRDQYTRLMTVVQERLAEAIKMPQMIPIIQSQVFLCFRVLLVRLSPQNLNALWPIILHEVLQTMIQMETDLLTQQQSHLYLYLQLCKLLQVALNLSRLSHFQIFNMFQLYRWTFVGPATPSFTPHLTRIAGLLEPLNNAENSDFDLTKTTKIESIAELYPFLTRPEEEVELDALELGLQVDFVE